jgi:hypothetical protein
MVTEKPVETYRDFIQSTKDAQERRFYILAPPFGLQNIASRIGKTLLKKSNFKQRNEVVFIAGLAIIKISELHNNRLL